MKLVVKKLKKLSSGRLITRNSIHVCHTHIPVKTFLTDTDKKAELKPHPIPTTEPTYKPVLPNTQIALIQVQITKLLAVNQMNVRVNPYLRLRRH